MYSIPAGLVINWKDYCGIPGGIPERTTIYRSFFPSATLAEVNAAIAACPAEQVVYLTAGTYNFAAVQLLRKAGVTVRGFGPGATILDTTSTTAAIISTSTGFSNPHLGTTEPIASGYTKGSTAIVLASSPPAQYVAGNLLQITQNDDYILVWHRTANWAGERNLRFTTRILSVVGNTINLATPIPYTYQAGLNPQAQAIAPGPSLFGIEEMTIDATGALQCARLYAADRCWLKDVELKGASYDLALFWDSSQCEMRRCYSHDVLGFPQTEGYSLTLQYGCSYFRIEDNIFSRTAMMLMNSAAGCFVGYNYAREIQRSTLAWVWSAFVCNHGPHSIMDLWEGNIGSRFQNDGYHGSASHQTLFRNSFNGLHPANTYERQLVDLCRASYYHNVVGNVLGDASWAPTQYEMTGSPGHSDSCIYQLGYPNSDSTSLTEETHFDNWTAAYPDAGVAATLIRHANYDYFNHAVQYEDADHAIADSLFYDSKPAYFGTLVWPPINPFTPTVHDIPAKWRWDTYQVSGLLSDLFADSPTITSYLFATGRKALLDGSVHWLADTIKVCGIDSVIHDPDPNVDEFLDDIDAGAILFTSGALAGKTSTGGVADADDTTIAGVLSGVEVDCLVLFKDTGDASTSTLIAKVNSSTGIVFKANGAGFDIVWPSGATRIFSL